MARTIVADVTRRLGAAVVSVGAVVVLSFVIFRLLPGDPVTAMTRGRAVTTDQIAQLRVQLGLDQPWPRQFVDYLHGLLRGDLGTSYTYHRPVVDVIGERLMPTLTLAVTATVISALLGLWVGVQSGWLPGGRLDRLATGLSLMLWSMPAFWLALLLVVVLGVGVGPMPGLFPTGGMRTPGAPSAGPDGLLDVAVHLVLPCLTLVLAQTAPFVVVSRAAMLDQHGKGYLLLARAKGLREAQVRRRHAVPNVLLPVLAVVFTNLGFVVSGVITVETVYSWPGLGRLMYEALTHLDLPLLQGLFLLTSGVVVAASTLADGTYRLADPRLRPS